MMRKLLFNIRESIYPRKTGEEANVIIRRLIQSGEPFMLARFGAVEIKGILYGILPPPIRWCLKKYVYQCMPNNAGFFPINDVSLKKFAKLMLADSNEIDVLASWRIEELFFYNKLKKVNKIGLLDLLPAYHGKFWTDCLIDKKVLVVHPFAETIISQYRFHRAKLFEDRSILPKFASLETVKAVQTIAGNKSEHKTWFDALDYMKHEIDKHDYDVCLIGCGAYGFPLAAHCKRQGKQAIHFGGSLQILFGIKGKRWNHLNMYNEYWVSPSDKEKPKGLEKVEGGCYW